MSTKLPSQTDLPIVLGTFAIVFGLMALAFTF